MYLAKIAMDIEAKHLPADIFGARIAELNEQIVLAVEVQNLLALCNSSAYAGGGEAAAETVACAADPLGEGTLRDELNLKLACDILILCNGVETDVSGEKLADLMVGDHSAKTLISHTAGNADSGDVFYALLDETGDDLFCGDLAVPVSEQNGLSILKRSYCLF